MLNALYALALAQQRPFSKDRYSAFHDAAQNPSAGVIRDEVDERVRFRGLGDLVGEQSRKIVVCHMTRTRVRPLLGESGVESTCF